MPATSARTGYSKVRLAIGSYLFMRQAPIGGAVGLTYGGEYCADGAAAAMPSYLIVYYLLQLYHLTHKEDGTRGVLADGVDEGVVE